MSVADDTGRLLSAAQPVRERSAKDPPNTSTAGWSF